MSWCISNSVRRPSLVMVSLVSAWHTFIFLHAIICCCWGVQAEVEPPPSNWDYLIFTQEWPQSACIAYKGENSQRACEIFSNVTSWTVHGVWPTKAGTKGPHNCQKLPFDLEKLRQIEPSLLMRWPNIYAGKSVYSLWKHEWLKHGTCAAELPSIGDEHDYFALGLHWSATYQPLSVLETAGVRPGADRFQWAQIRDALTAHFSTKMIVDCELDRETKLWYLTQIKLCLDKSFVPTDCHNKSEPISTACPAEGILYPPIIPTPVPVLKPERTEKQESGTEQEQGTVPGKTPAKEELVEIFTIELSKNEVVAPTSRWYSWYRMSGRPY
ncbi:ribonuclease Oy-like isoform X2 [Amphibalanus amphitrite]|uniref:ribonuclease Oy-like isoform X2 n=1 Tax=Amphibalanus amphitrite TaxID=1232801 RepID=UPI001C920F2E|nr:ribonuclease Oy-like isoform X2 [Amphibalanus amphitrite]